MREKNLYNAVRKSLVVKARLIWLVPVRMKIPYPLCIWEMVASVSFILPFALLLHINREVFLAVTYLMTKLLVTHDSMREA